MGSILGNRVVRVEDPRLLTVGGTYVEDIELAGAAWVVYVRSPHAHARIIDIDTSDAASAPGVVAVFTSADLSPLGLVPHPSPAFPDAMRRPFLAIDTVRYVGEPVVAVVADDRMAATDAADLVLVDYEPLPAVVDPEAALADEVVLFPEHGTNTVMRFASRQQADFSACEVVVEARIVNQRLTAAPIEGRSGAAYWTDDGRLVHYSACQGAHPTKALLAEIYGLPPAQVRVIVPDVGGGFGAKARTYPEELALGVYARQLGRPVRWTETRTENILGDAQRARPGAARQAGREPRRPDHRIPARRRPGRRRLPARRRGAAGDDAAHGDGRVRHRQRRLHRRLRRDQHGVDDGVPRRRPSRSGGGDRADGRSLRRRDRDGPGRRSPEELRRPLHGALHDGYRHGL